MDKRSISDGSRTTSTRRRCSYCQNEDDRLLRCQRCRTAWYCSTTCQRQDWKEHRILCNNNNNNKEKGNDVTTTTLYPKKPIKKEQAKKALQELATIVSSASTSDMNKDYHIASDMSKVIEKESDNSSRQKNRNVTTNRLEQQETTSSISAPVLAQSTNISKNISKTTMFDDVNQTLREKNDTDFKATNRFIRGNSDSPTTNSIPTINNNKTTFMEQQWNVYAEDMYHVHCYQVLIRPRIQQKLKLEHFELTFLPSSSTNNLQQQQKSMILWRYNTIMNGVSELVPEQSFCMEFRKEIIPTSPRVYLVDSDEAISIRLSYSTKDSEENIVESLVLLKPNQAQDLCCRFCYNPLFASFTKHSENGGMIENKREKTRTINRVMRLPSCRWNDMDDFLICYPGQPVINFTNTSSTIEDLCLMEDETVIVANSKDISTRSVCVLAMSGYGERSDERCWTSNNHNGSSNIILDSSSSVENNSTISVSSKFESMGISSKDPSALIRGVRDWRESMEGATLTCSLCTSIVGFAPIFDETQTPISTIPTTGSTYRFLKHRLALVLPSPICDSVQVPPFYSPVQPPNIPLLSVAEFIAHEMIRYAETKAIFSFLVTVDDIETTKTRNEQQHKQQQQNKKCFILRILSWDSMASKGEIIPQNNNNNTNTHQIQFTKWNRVAKIAYEESLESTTTPTTGGKNITNNNTNNTLWMWASQDLCCPLVKHDSGSLVGKERDEKEKRDTITNNHSSIVRFYLSPTEMNELIHSFTESSKLFSKDVIETIIVAQTGKVLPTTNAIIGLAAIPVKY